MLFASASFRGVPFEVELGEDIVGRDSVLHQFPKRDLPYSEDMGKAARIIDITGFVGGANWLDARDALIAALNQPGPGVLVHPWYGELTVCTNGPSKVRQQGGVSRVVAFSMSFVETDGEAASPTVSPHNQGLVAGQANLSMSSVAASLDGAVALAGQASAVAQNLVSGVQEIAGVVKQVQSGDILGAASWLSSTLGFDASSLGQLVSQGKALSSVLMPLFTSWLDGKSSNPQAISGAFFKIAATSPKLTPPQNPGTVSAKTYQAQSALAQFQREAATVQACHAVSLLVPTTRTQGAKVRQQLFEAVESCLLSTTNNELFGQLLDLRQLALVCLAQNEAAAPDIVTVQENAVLPSLVVAYRQVVRMSASPPSLLHSEADLLTRNAIIHPGFLPGGEPLEVLRHVR